MLTLTCMFLLHAVQQRNQTGQFYVDPEKDRHCANCRIELFADLRPKAVRAGRLVGGLVIVFRLMIEAGLNRVILTEDQQQARHRRSVVLSLEAHDLALQPRQPMKSQQLLNPHGMRPMKMPFEHLACARICQFLRGSDGFRNCVIDLWELVGVLALGLVLLHPLMQLFVLALGIRVVVDPNPAVERSPQDEVESCSEESFLLFERLQCNSYLEVAAGLELKRGHQLAVAQSSAPANPPPANILSRSRP